MNALAIIKALPSIMRGQAIIITVSKRKVRADCGRLSDKTVRQIAEGLLSKVTN